MKQYVASILAFGLTVSFASITAQAASQQKIEVPVSRVFIPKEGFDDNDQITATVYGELPNPCYTLGKTVVSRGTSTHKLTFKQLAYLKKDGPCGTGDLIDDPVEFSNDVMLGQIDSGFYQIEYLKSDGTEGFRDFNVGRASPTAGIDNFDYAMIHSADSAPFYHKNEAVRIHFKGWVQSKCYELVKPLRVDHIDDIFVVMPILKESGTNCEKQNQKFVEALDLGILKPATYMLHVRSRNGKALSQVFKVLSD